MIVNELSRSRGGVAWYRVDVYVFGMLLLTLMLYQLQLLIPQFSSFHVREVLYAFLYARVIFFYRIRMTGLLIAVLIFVAFSALVGLHTYYLYGFGMAEHGFTRFVHLVLIAPLAAWILVDDGDVMSMFHLWVIVVLAGVMTVLYQMLGGEMQWLVQKYIATRGDLIRYKSLMGEPNVGGMAAALAYLFASLAIRNQVLKYIVLFASTFLVVASLSKAAFVGFVFANVAVLFIDLWRARKKDSNWPSRELTVQAVIMTIWFSLLLFNSVMYRYMEVGLDSFLGRQLAVPGAVEDIRERAIDFKYGIAAAASEMAHQPTSEPLLREAIKNTDVAASEVAHQPTSEPFALSGTWLGQSFGRAGSAALEMNVPKAAGPHNMYLEVYIVGGLVFLGSLISVQLLALRVMLGRALSGHFMYQMSLALFSLICLYMTGYPNIYEPITGSLFWLIIGIAARAQPSNRFAA